VSDKKPHPITTMAAPTERRVREALVTLSYFLRENAGSSERLLDDSDIPDVRFDQVLHPAQLAAMAITCSVLAESLHDQESSKLFVVASTDLNCAAAHLVSQIAHEPLVNDYEHTSREERFIDLQQAQRRFAARATKSGRQLTHLGLSRLSEIWPEAYEKDDEARDHGGHE